MDVSELFASLLARTVTFFLDLFIGGLFDFLSDILFGGPSSGLI